jgi:hypothetical protein
MSSARMVAKQIVKVRQQREKMYKSKATLSAINTHTTVRGLSLRDQKIHPISNAHILCACIQIFLMHLFSPQFQAAKANMSMTSAMSGATRAMQAANSSPAMANISQTLMEYDKQMQRMETTEEFVSCLQAFVSVVG